MFGGGPVMDDGHDERGEPGHSHAVHDGQAGLPPLGGEGVGEAGGLGRPDGDQDDSRDKKYQITDRHMKAAYEPENSMTVSTQ